MSTGKLILILCISLFLYGCASIEVIPPIKSNVINNKVFNFDSEIAWSKAVDWFADHNVKIEKIEKSSGLLTARNRLFADETDLDCGTIKIVGAYKRSMNRFGTLNVTVRPVGNNQSRIKVNFFGEYELKAYDAWNDRLMTRNGVCLSTGMLEQDILNFIGSK